MVDSDPLKRPKVEDVARDALLDARPVELRDCGSCWEKRRLEDGLECADKQHFLCKDCLESGLRAYLEPDSDRDPRVGRDLKGATAGDRGYVCPVCGSQFLSDERQFNLMFKSSIGPVDPMSAVAAAIEAGQLNGLWG